ncbi:UNVERIFIED_CONTAM: hypothetical protein DES50_11130 [Williamsia faeni]
MAVGCVGVLCMSTRWELNTPEPSGRRPMRRADWTASSRRWWRARGSIPQRAPKSSGRRGSLDGEQDWTELTSQAGYRENGLGIASELRKWVPPVRLELTLDGFELVVVDVCRSLALLTMVGFCSGGEFFVFALLERVGRFRCYCVPALVDLRTNQVVRTLPAVRTHCLSTGEIAGRSMAHREFDYAPSGQSGYLDKVSIMSSLGLSTASSTASTSSSSSADSVMTVR